MIAHVAFQPLTGLLAGSRLLLYTDGLTEAVRSPREPLTVKGMIIRVAPREWWEVPIWR